MSVEVNMLAVVLAAVSSMVVGGIWYAKGVFGDSWGKMAKVDEKRMRERSPKTLPLAFVMSFITAYVLAHMAFIANRFFGNTFLKDSLMTGFWLWLGFTATRLVVHDAFEIRRQKLTLMNCAHELVTIMAMALIIGVMKP